MRLEIIILSVLIFLVIIFWFKRPQTKYTIVKIGDTKIKSEIADNLIKQTKGLMFRKVLPENEGMLFVFDKEDYYRIWMMNMSFPIDIIWINEDREIVEIFENAPPCKLKCTIYESKEKALYVLEVNANFTKKYGIEIGSSVEFKL